MITILCPIDFTPGSENAVKYAHELAQLMRARLILFLNEPVNAPSLVVSGSGANDVYGLPEPCEDDVKNHKLQVLKEKLEAGTPQSSVTVETVLKKCTEKDTIPALILQEKVDLMIVGNSEDYGTQNSFSETGLTEMIRQASCPVLIIPKQVSFKPLWKIVYATDLKTEPANDCTFLLKLAHLFNAEIMLLHVLTQDVVGAREFATEELQKVYSTLPYRNISFYIEANEFVESGINEFVRENKADLLVLSNHPEQIWQHLLPGRNRVCNLYQAQLPILIRRHSGSK